MTYNEKSILKRNEEPLLKDILKKMAGFFEIHDLCIKETTQVVGHTKLTKRNIVTHSDRSLLEIMPNGSLREMNDYIYKRVKSDNIKMPKSPEGSGEVRDRPLDQDWTLVQKGILTSNLPKSSNNGSSQPKRRRP